MQTTARERSRNPPRAPCAQVANFLSNLPAYRTGVSPLLRGVEIGLTHGFFVAGPFIKLGPLRATEAAEVSGSLSAAGLVLILTACLSSARPAPPRAPLSRSTAYVIRPLAPPQSTAPCPSSRPRWSA